MASRPNVLRAEPLPEQNSGPSPCLFGRVASRDYRAAVAQTIRELKAEKQIGNEELAEKLGCSESTISNAERESGNLDPVTMLNLGAIYGGERRIRRILALIGGSPDEPPTVEDRLDRIEHEAAAIRRDIA